jgi:hypothetical protein
MRRADRSGTESDTGDTTCHARVGTTRARTTVIREGLNHRDEVDAVVEAMFVSPSCHFSRNDRCTVMK